MEYATKTALTMANPRKFSEKIALHNQKQAEETAAFEQIMREVMGATRVPPQSVMTADNYDEIMSRNWNSEHNEGIQNTRTYQNNHLHIAQSLGAYRGGSLPNVNQMSNSSIDLQSALTNLEDMKQGRDHSSDRGHRERGRHIIPHRNRQFMIEKRGIDVSPYGSTSYLSPPSDTNWRRTNSDSALHQSAMAPQENFNSANTSPTQRRGTVHEMDSGTFLLDTGQMRDYSWDPKDTHLMANFQSRPKSCEVPGINIFPTQEDPNIVHALSLSNNTGSLPDLTNLHFPPPLATPLDIEDQSGGAPGSPYSQATPPHSSPSMVSQQSRIIGSSMVGGGTLIHSSQSGGGGGSISPGPSLTSSISSNSVNNISGVNQLNHSSVHSPTSRRRQHQLSNLVIGGGGGVSPNNGGSVMASVSHHNHHFPHHHHHQQLPPQCMQRVRQDPPPPRITVEGLAIDTNALSLDAYSPQQVYGLYQQQPQSPTHQNIQQNYGPPSPSLPQMKVVSYRSASPSETSCSAPTSPASHTHSPASSPGLGPATSLSKSPFTDTTCFIHQQQANLLQNQLEQFRMVAESPPLQQQQQQHHQQQQQQHQQQQQQQQHHQNQQRQHQQSQQLQLQNQHSQQQNRQQQQQHQQDHEQFLLMHDTNPVCTTSSPTTPPSPGVYLAGLGGGGCGPPGNDLTMSHSGQRLVNNHNGICGTIGCGDDSGLLDNDSVYYCVSTSDIMIPQSPTYYSKSANVISSSSHQTTPQTPQTPTSIPDIILTAPDQLLRQDFAKDLGSAMASMSGSFDSDIFSNDEVLRPMGVLDPIDFEGLHMLSDADPLSVISDSVGDDSFHLDRS